MNQETEDGVEGSGDENENGDVPIKVKWKNIKSIQIRFMRNSSLHSWKH